MDQRTYRFRIGSFVCTVISDGRYIFAPPVFPPPADFIFSNAPREQIETAFQKRILKLEERYFWSGACNCLLVDSGEHKILIDTGGGSFGHETGQLYRNLLAAGAAPGTINQVVLTHAHPDHIGGCTESDGRPAFPNAHYIIAREEWNFWRSERAKNEIREFNREMMLKTEYDNLPSIRNQVELIDGAVDILPGVSLIPAPGHTPGQMAVLLNSQNRRLLFVSDAFYHPVQVQRPDWSGIADLDSWNTVNTRLRLLNLAASENALVMGFHFPFPGLGWVIKYHDSYLWLEHKIETPEPLPEDTLSAGMR